MRITVDWPGATPADVDRAVAKPIGDALKAAGIAGSISASSREGLADLTVRAAAGLDVETFDRKVRAALAEVADKLPADANDPFVEEMPPGFTPPMPAASGGPELRIELSAVGRKLGLTDEALSDAVEEAAGNADDHPDALADLHITLPDGRKVPLAEVATVTLVRAPDPVTRTWD